MIPLSNPILIARCKLKKCFVRMRFDMKVTPTQYHITIQIIIFVNQREIITHFFTSRSYIIIDRKTHCECSLISNFQTVQ